MNSILKVALNELSAPSVASPITIPVESKEDINIEQFEAGKHLVLCTVGMHHELSFQPSFFEQSVKEFSGKRLYIYQGHADSDRYAFMSPEPMELGFCTNLSFSENTLYGDRYYTDPTALNNYKAGNDEGLSIYWDARNTIEDVLNAGEVTGENALLLSVSRTKRPCDPATMTPAKELSISQELYEFTSAPDWSEVDKTKEGPLKKEDFLINDGDVFTKWKFPIKLNGKYHTGAIAAAMRYNRYLPPDKRSKLEKINDAMQKKEKEMSIMDTKTDTKEATQPLTPAVPTVPAPAPIVPPVQELSDIKAEREKLENELAEVKKAFEEHKAKYVALSAEFATYKDEQAKALACAKRTEKMKSLSKLMLAKMGRDMTPEETTKYTNCSEDVIDEKIATLNEFTGVAFGGKVPAAPTQSTPTRYTRGSDTTMAKKLMGSE